jgi:hypothetical protein
MTLQGIGSILRYFGMGRCVCRMLLSDLLGGSSKKVPATKGKQPAKAAEVRQCLSRV